MNASINALPSDPKARFDVLLGWNFPTRVKLGATADDVLLYCSKHGYVVRSFQQLGLTIHEVFLVKQ